MRRKAYKILTLVIWNRFIFLCEQSEGGSWVDADLSTELTGADTLVDQFFNFPELLLVLDSQLKEVGETERFLINNKVMVNTGY